MKTKGMIVSICLAIALIIVSIIPGAYSYLYSTTEFSGEITCDAPQLQYIDNYSDELLTYTGSSREPYVINNGNVDAWIFYIVKIPITAISDSLITERYAQTYPNTKPEIDISCISVPVRSSSETPQEVWNKYLESHPVTSLFGQEYSGSTILTELARIDTPSSQWTQIYNSPYQTRENNIYVYGTKLTVAMGTSPSLCTQQALNYNIYGEI